MINLLKSLKKDKSKSSKYISLQDKIEFMSWARDSNKLVSQQQEVPLVSNIKRALAQILLCKFPGNLVSLLN